MILHVRVLPVANRKSGDPDAPGPQQRKRMWKNKRSLYYGGIRPPQRPSPVGRPVCELNREIEKFICFVRKKQERSKKEAREKDKKRKKGERKTAEGNKENRVNPYTP